MEALSYMQAGCRIVRLLMLLNIGVRKYCWKYHQSGVLTWVTSKQAQLNLLQICCSELSDTNSGKVEGTRKRRLPEAGWIVVMGALSEKLKDKVRDRSLWRISVWTLRVNTTSWNIITLAVKNHCCLPSLSSPFTVEPFSQ